MKVKRPPWTEWITVIVAVIAAVAAIWAARSSSETARSAERQSIASEALAEETRAPDLDAEAWYLRTPVPDPTPFVRATGSASDTILAVEIYRPFIGSRGVWHVTVQNNGDAVATNVRIRAPGIFYARQSGFATGRGLHWTRVENETLPLGDLAPRQLSSAVLWVEPNHTLAEICVEPIAPPGCFTHDDLIVFADNASGDVQFTLFEPPTSVAPSAEITQPEEDPFRFWGPLAISLAILAIVLAVIAGMQIERRSAKHSRETQNDQT